MGERRYGGDDREGHVSDPFDAEIGPCLLVASTTQGPCTTETDIVREDISDGWTGLPVRLAIKVVDGACNPLAGATIKIWHTNLEGSYSGQTPSNGMCLKDQSYASANFCSRRANHGGRRNGLLRNPLSRLVPRARDPYPLSSEGCRAFLPCLAVVLSRGRDRRTSSRTIPNTAHTGCRTRPSPTTASLPPFRRRSGTASSSPSRA